MRTHSIRMQSCLLRRCRLEQVLEAFQHFVLYTCTNRHYCYEHTQKEDLRDLKNEEVSIRLRCYLITTVLFASR